MSRKPATAKPAVTLETVLCDPRFFGLTTATNVQRAICRIVEGRPLGDLANDPDVREVVGGSDALECLAYGTFRPREIDILAAIRSAKSLFIAAHALWSALTIDLSKLRAGEVARYAILSVNLTSAAATFNHFVGTVQSNPLLRGLLVEDPTDGRVLVKRPDGRHVEIVTVAGARAGATLISVWLLGVAFEEYPRQAGEGYAVNYGDQLQAAVGRVVDGGQILSVGSPWAPFGPAYERFREFHGHPSLERVIVKASGPQMNPGWWTPERCEALRKSNPSAFTTDVLAGFADQSSTYIPQSHVTRAVAAEPAWSPRRGWGLCAAMDPGTRSNGWTLILLAGRRGVDDCMQYEVLVAHEWRGSSAEPISPKATLGEIARILAPYEIRTVFTDQHSADAYVDLGANIGLQVVRRNVVAGNRRDDRVVDVGTIFRNDLYENMAGVFGANGISIPNEPVLVRDLLSVRRITTRLGVGYELPTTADGRHADYAPALALALSEWNTWQEEAPSAATRGWEAQTVRELEARVSDALAVQQGAAGQQIAGCHTPESRAAAEAAAGQYIADRQQQRSGGMFG